MNTISIIGQIDSYSRYLLKNDLDAHAGKPVTVKINSLGGYVHEGVAMAQMLQAHGDVTVEITGFIASAATIVALGAKKVQMHTSSMWLAHKCMQWIDAWGNYNADEIKDMISKLEGMKKNNEAIDLNIASIYLNKCGNKKNMNDVKKMMTDATWMSAEECMEWGFVDELIEDGSVNVSDELKMVMNSMGIAVPGTPAPHVAVATASAKEDSNEPSWLNKILNAIAGKKNAEADEEIINLKNSISSYEKIVNDLKDITKEYDDIIEMIDSSSDSIKNEADRKKKVQMMIDIINAIPANVKIEQVKGDEIDKFGGMATDVANSYVNE